MLATMSFSSCVSASKSPMLRIIGNKVFHAATRSTFVMSRDQGPSANIAKSARLIWPAIQHNVRQMSTSQASISSEPPSARASIRKLTSSDIMPMKEYLTVYKPLQAKFRKPLKQLRRVELGPSASFLFTNYDLIWFQVHEMLRIEMGGDEQVLDEIDAYKDLIPQVGEVVGCLMYEIDNAKKRAVFLDRMAGSERDMQLNFGGEVVIAKSIHDDIERTHPVSGRTSAVHFLRFMLTKEQIAKFGSGPVVLKMDNKLYPHMTELPADLVKSIAREL